MFRKKQQRELPEAFVPKDVNEPLVIDEEAFLRDLNEEVQELSVNTVVPNEASQQSQPQSQQRSFFELHISHVEDELKIAQDFLEASKRELEVYKQESDAVS